MMYLLFHNENNITLGILIKISGRRNVYLQKDVDILLIPFLFFTTVL